MSVAVDVLKYIGNISALVFFATPLFHMIIKKFYRDIELIRNVSLALIVSILFNCLFWLLNAISSGDLSQWIPLLISNIGGLVINLVLLFLYLFVFLERNKKKFLVYGFFVVNLLVEVGYFFYRFIIKDSGKDSFHLIGFIATLINVFMYSSPYFNYKQVINSKNAGAIPIYTLGSGIFTCIIFFIQGFVSYRSISGESDKDEEKQNHIETMVSNAINFILLGVLSALYACNYYKNKSNNDEVLDIGLNNGDEQENENINEGMD